MNVDNNVSVWGFGFHFSKIKSKLADFFNNNFICVGYSKDDAPEFIEMMKEIKKGDIVYLKSWQIKGSVLHIKAIGVVTNTFSDTNIYGGDNKIEVDWKVTNIDETVVANTKYRQRVTSIYKEYNTEISAIIKNLLAESV